MFSRWNILKLPPPTLLKMGSVRIVVSLLYLIALNSFHDTSTQLKEYWLWCKIDT